MQPRDFLLAIISLCGERPEFGRTSLQKVAYLAALRFDLDFGHRAYYYGPFSAEVEADTEALAFSGLIKESVEELDFVGQGGFPARQFRFLLSETGVARVERLKETFAEQFAQLGKFVEELVAVVGSLDQRMLSAAAKTVFIAREQGRPVTAEEIKTIAKDMGWSLTIGRIAKVTEMLGRLKLVSVSKTA
jgi:uncharacterized protein YwgA